MDQLLVSPDRLAQLEELLLLFHRILTDATATATPPRLVAGALPAQERR